MKYTARQAVDILAARKPMSNENLLKRYLGAKETALICAKL